jgi:putative transposase
MKGNIFHLLNRGVEKRKIFLSDENYIRFIHNMRDFNNKDNVTMSYYNRRKYSDSEVRPPNKNLVDVVCWCLMPNHPHIMAIEKDEGNISNFSRKIFGGYTMYFNEQNDRSGVVFQGNTKIIQIKKDAHLLYLPFYIHLNPLDLFQSGWKEDGIKDIEGAIKFLEEFRWSNYRDIIGVGNGEFEAITNKKLFFEMFQTNPKKYKKDLEEWIRSEGYKEDFNKFE